MTIITITQTPTIDNERAIGLLVTQFNCPELPQQPLSDVIQQQAAKAIQSRWSAAGMIPDHPANALVTTLIKAWAELNESERLIWMSRLIEVTSNA